MHHLGADGQAPYDPGDNEGSQYGYDHNGNGSQETPSYGRGGGGGGDPPPPPVTQTYTHRANVKCTLKGATQPLGTEEPQVPSTIYRPYVRSSDSAHSGAHWYEKRIHKKVDGDREKIPEVKGAKPMTPNTYMAKMTSRHSSLGDPRLCAGCAC
ncbi:hypothetical protein BV22DRAFT_1049105 [Leucogyrophana mollusca]|uniref:Uncharacterized protein n=1 Tax=Leucogyrophana mollusca TaxID=85980 RepID=A0ACB8B973_9AGAM|nr:hypothetical protein BV22DRAFT_1049105 [Leucogyrophana mollusca]